LQTPAAPSPDARAAPKKEAARPKGGVQRHLATAVFFTGLVLTAAGFIWCVGQETASTRADLVHRGASLATAIQRETGRRIELLDALGAYVETTHADNRGDLRLYLTSLVRDRGQLIAMDWVPRVPVEALKAYEEKQWVGGVPDFHVHRAADPLPAAPEYLPLQYGVGAGLRVDDVDLKPGSDLSATPGLSIAFEAARTRRGATAAAPLAVTRADGIHRALPIVSPVFVASDGGSTLAGYAFGLFDLEDILRLAFAQADRETVSVELRDGAPGGGPVFSQKALQGEDDTVLVTLWRVLGVPPPASSSDFDVAGRQWSMVVTAGPRLLSEHLTWIPWFAALAGLMVSVAMATTVSGYAHRGEGLASARRRLSTERRDYMEKVSSLTDELERERLDRRRTEESLFREKQQFRLMFNSVPAMICYKDTKNRFLLVNEAAASSMGRTVDDMEGKPCSEIIPARAYELYRDDLEIVQSGKPKLGLIEETELPSGKSIWTRTDKLPEYDAMGRVVGILVFSQDITEHRQAEAEIRRLNEELEQRVGVRTAELRAANQELESFAYSVSHDLRTPLRTIDGFSKLVIEEHGHELSQPAHEYLARLRNAAQRMGHLIDDLLKLTRVSRAELRREQVDLSAMARQVIDDLKSTSRDRHVAVVIEATPFASGDPVLLLNVVENLLSNAWKFTARSREPRIEFGSKTVSGDRTAFYVRDNGVGFDMVYADKLFGAFQRLHSHGEFEGSGIGLATVQLIIRRHAGEVWAESVPDQGATFYFTLGS
jgi:hypothetical protein